MRAAGYPDGKYTGDETIQVVGLAGAPDSNDAQIFTILPKNGDCRKKSADDQAAQLYVVWTRFPEAMRSQIIGYIWDTTAPAGTIVSSEKTSTVTYVVMRSGTADLGKWITERRNVADDYKKIYGGQPDGPGIISIAIDSDDTVSSAESFFGPIIFRKP